MNSGTAKQHKVCAADHAILSQYKPLVTGRSQHCRSMARRKTFESMKSYHGADGSDELHVKS